MNTNKISLISISVTESDPLIGPQVVPDFVPEVRPLDLAQNKFPASGADAVLSPLMDFWLLGGASIAIWLALLFVGQWRGDVELVQMRFMQIPVVFSLLALVCNHPHFMVSYKFAYGRGIGFVLKNWFALILVPICLAGGYFAAFKNFNAEIGGWSAIARVNQALELLGIQFQFGASSNFGSEFLGLSIWLMYLTVGWHYAKQVFGAVLIQARYASYPITAVQRMILKLSVFSVAIFQFIYVVQLMNPGAVDGRIQDPRFTGVYMSSLGLPIWALTLATAAVGISFSAVLIFVLWSNWSNHRKKPSVNLLMPWVAFHIWWIPLSVLPEFYLAMIPFFHSLQYLPFAYKLESRSVAKKTYRDLRISLTAIGVLVGGFLCFEFVPSLLDTHFETSSNQTAWFFVTAFAVFINIHHFFIDSVLWRFTDPKVRSAFSRESSLTDD